MWRAAISATLSDTSTCQVAHPDRPQHNGFMAYTTETRGALKKLLPTCTQPTAQEIAREEAFQKKQQEIYDANVAKANPQPAAQSPSGGSANQAGMNPAQIAPPKNAEERAMRRCVSSGRPACHLHRQRAAGRIHPDDFAGSSRRRQEARAAWAQHGRCVPGRGVLASRLY